MSVFKGKGDLLVQGYQAPGTASEDSGGDEDKIVQVNEMQFGFILVLGS